MKHKTKPSKRIDEIAHELKLEYTKAGIIVDYENNGFIIEAIIKYLDETYGQN